MLEDDLAGFPNGRRPGDDVVDIALRAVMGVLLPASQAPTGQLPYTDGAINSATIAYDPEGTVSADPKNRLFRDSVPVPAGAAVRLAESGAREVGSVGAEVTRGRRKRVDTEKQRHGVERDVKV